MSLSLEPVPNWEASVSQMLLDHVMDAGSGWSCGGFGAIAEFVWDAEENIRFDSSDGIVAVTGRGAIRIDPVPELRPVAYEMISRDAEAWQQGIALCLPATDCAMGRRTVLTELGPDRDALRPEDRNAVLFDMGLNQAQVDVCVRTGDPRALDLLRTYLGRSLLEPSNPVMSVMPGLSPHRVIRCRFGRVEVYQPIPGPGGTSPDGPHTHVLPKLLSHQRTHAANVPIPEGWVPCMTLFPANPMRDRNGRLKPFDAYEHEVFQALFAQFGDPELVAIKQAVTASIRSGREFPESELLSETRAGRTTARVALRQLRQLDQSSLAMAAIAQMEAAAGPGREFDELG